MLAATESGYLLLETDAGIVTLNPQAAQERVAYEKLISAYATENANAATPLVLLGLLLILRLPFVQTALSGVTIAIHYSRNHMRIKKGKPARPTSSGSK